MPYFIIVIILFAIIFQVVSAVKEMKADIKESAYTKLSIHLLIAVFMSVLLSISIALNADIPASSGHGGFIYILGPGAIGIIVLVLYLLLLPIWPQKKVILGLNSILINIIIGFYFMFTDF